MQKQTNPKPSGAPMAKLVLIICVIISLSVLLGVIGYALTKPKCAVQNPPVVKEVDETADWKTYQNEDFGVKFSYPKDWYFSPPKDWYVYFGEPEGKILLGKELAVSPYTGERDPLYKIFKIISANPTEIALKFLKGKYNSSYYTVELQEKFNFQKKQAQKVLITCTSEYYTEQEIEAKEEMIIVVLDDYTSFIIPLSNRSPKYAYPFTKEQSDIINQILSTFKFIEKDETGKNYKRDCTDK